jgi:putative transposase
MPEILQKFHSHASFIGVGRAQWRTPKNQAGRKSASRSVGRRERYVAKRPNQAWSMDFVADQLVNGTRLRALTVIDIFTREALCIRVGHRLRAEHVVDACDQLVATRGAPARVFVDNGSEFSGRL